MASESKSLDSRAFGLACALLWSAAVVVLGITARVGWGKRWQRLLADVYRGYDESVAGLVVGALWAFLDGFTGGYAFARLYDRLARGDRAEPGRVDQPGGAAPDVEASVEQDA